MFKFFFKRLRWYFALWRAMCKAPKPKRFASLSELIEQAKKDGACWPGFNWLKRQPTLELAIKECPVEYRIWAMGKGYRQFEVFKDFDALHGGYFVALVEQQPRYADFFNWDRIARGHSMVREACLDGHFINLYLSKRTLKEIHNGR